MPRVVLSLLTQDNAFQVFQADDARQEAARQGLDLEVLYADGNAVLQIQHLFRRIHIPEEIRPAALIVQPVSDQGMERVARNAVEAGIGWIVLNRRPSYLPGLAARHPDVPVSSVSIDQREIGRLQGRQFRALLPSGGGVLYVQGPLHSPAVGERLAGAREVMQGSGIELTLVDADWTAEGAENAVTAWSRGKLASSVRIDVVGGQNDEMAMGARRALQGHPDPERRRQWDRLRYTGVDGLPEGGQRMVDRGELTATVVGPSNGGPAVELAARFLQGRRPIPAEVLQSPTSYPPIERLVR